MDNAGPDGAVLKISLAVVILQRHKVMRCVQFLLDRGLFLKNRKTLPKKPSVRPSSRLKTVDLDYRSSLSVAWLGQILIRKFTKFGRPRQTVATR